MSTRTLAPKKWFEEWRDPRIFFNATSDCMNQFEADEILRMPNAQYLFDAYVAGLFARIWNDHKSCKVRLLPDDFPDAEISDLDGIHPIEVTLADRADRRMAEEHRIWREQRERGESSSRPIERDKDREYSFEAIPRACRNKAEKYLGSSPSERTVPVSLLLYVNFSTLFGPVLTDEEMVDLTAPWKKNFLAIWLLCGARAFRPWPTPSSMSAVSDPLA